jgi:hypothetical protein
VSRKKQRG